MEIEYRKVIEKYKKIIQEQKKVIIILAITVFTIASLFALVYVPPWRVAQFGINDSVKIAELENSYRATIAQIIGGFAIIIGLYYTWQRITIAENNLKIAQEGQITERFTRAIDQLGNKKMEIRVGGIHALERISKESEDDYWPIMEVLTAYVRINSPFQNGNTKAEILKNAHNMNFMDMQQYLDIKTQIKVPLDIETIIKIIKNRKYRRGTYRDVKISKDFYDIYKNKPREPDSLDLQGTYLAYIDLHEAHLDGVILIGAFLESARLDKAHLPGAFLAGTIFRDASLDEADLGRAILLRANLEGASLQGADLEGADLSEADLSEADLRGTKGLTIDQLSKVKTLYNAELDDYLLIPLKEKYPGLFENPNFSCELQA